jgi:hypothetical protein
VPAKTERQRKMMGADLSRKRRGKKTRTGMTEKQLLESSWRAFKALAGGLVAVIVASVAGIMAWFRISGD